ncbi:MAG: tetratricopeptide repeat protein [Methanobacterium sp.]|nr:tetratricopeptide repeat protein [Methanobacterium sp.]
MVQDDAQEYIEQGSKFYELGSLEKAMTYYQKALDYLKATDDKKTEADTLLEIGNIYIEQDDVKNAQNYYEKSLNTYKNTEDSIGEGYALTGIGLIHEKQQRYADARNDYVEASEHFEAKSDRERKAAVISLIAGTYESQGAWEDAIMEYRRSASLYRKAGNKSKQETIHEKIENLSIERGKQKTSRNEKIMAVAYVFALILAEVTVTYVNKETGLVIEALILIALLVNSSFSVSYNYGVMLRSMMALPMIRIIGLSIPLMQIQPLYWFPIIALPLFAAAYTIMKNQGLTRQHIGLIWGNKKVQFLIALTGIFLGTIEYIILQPKPLIGVFNPVNLITASIILIISTGLAEELLFRGIIQKNAENVFGIFLGLLYTSILFTALHIGWTNIYDLIFVFSVAMFYGYAFQKTRSIVGVTLSHGISNSFLFLIVPFYAPLLFHYLPII